MLSDGMSVVSHLYICRRESMASLRAVAGRRVRPTAIGRPGPMDACFDIDFPGAILKVIENQFCHVGNSPH